MLFSIREWAQVIGKIVAAFPGVKWGPLHYKEMERQKTLAQKQNAGNSDAICSSLSKEADRELDWWSNNCGASSYPLITEKPAV